MGAVAADRGRARRLGPDRLALPPRGQGVRASTSTILAALRICLILLLVFMLSEAVLSVERTGLPYFTS